MWTFFLFNTDMLFIAMPTVSIARVHIETYALLNDTLGMSENIYIMARQYILKKTTTVNMLNVYSD